MTPQQIVGLAVRLFAIWLVLQGVPKLLQGIAGVNDPAMAPMAPSLIIFGAAYAIGAALLWIFPMWSAHKLVPRTGYDNVLNMASFDAARVGCALIGLWIFATTAQNIVWFFISALVAAGSGSVFAATSTELRIGLAVDVGQVALGAFLVFQSAWFARLVVAKD